MDKEQAEAAAQAVLQPGHQAQEEQRRNKAIQARKTARQRLIARFGVLGLVVGFAVGYFTHGNVLAFFGFGGAMGLVAGALVASWPRRLPRAP